MKKAILIIPVAAICSLFTAVNPIRAQGTAFSYQGRLNTNGSPANGLYDFQFSLFNAPGGGGIQIGGTIMQTAIGVTNGLFNTILDFGPVFAGNPTWLAISVRTNGVGSYAGLSPLQQLTPTPYAIYSENAATLGGQSPTAYVAKAGDTMTGALNLPPNGLVLGGSQLVASGGNVGIGTASPLASLDVFNPGQAYSRLYSANSANGSVFELREDAANTTYTGAINFNDAGNLGFGGQLGYGPGNGMTFRSGGQERMRIWPNGNVGIGTMSPANTLDVRGPINCSAQGVMLTSGAYAGWPNQTLLQGGWNGSDWVELDVPGATPNSAALRLTANGNVGIGTSSPAAKLHVFGGSAPGASVPTGTAVLASGSGDGGYNRFMSVEGNQAVYLQMYGASGYGELSTYDYSTGLGLELRLNANGGTVSVPVLEIRGGSDVAEPFPISSGEVPQGSVVIIDEEHPGDLKLSDQPYDTRVAGIVSGANGIHPGIQMHQQGLLEGGKNVALSGRVYVQADASNGPIHPGDLLTSSSTPGHAMKVTDHAKAQGAVLGKAMTALSEGKGMVLVLVTLQ